MNVNEAFEKEFGGGSNFMTPNLYKRGAIVRSWLYYEIAQGRGMRQQQIWGVTVVRVNPDGTTQRLPGLNKLEQSLGAAFAHVSGLKAQFTTKEEVWAYDSN